MSPLMRAMTQDFLDRLRKERDEKESKEKEKESNKEERKIGEVDKARII